jgi:hypothetical protein
VSKNELPPPEECANCGAAIPRHARACPECGADEHTGWRETDIYDGIDFPDEDRGREDTIDRRNASARGRAVNGIAWYWWAIGVLIIFLFGLGVLGLLR